MAEMHASLASSPNWTARTGEVRRRRQWSKAEKLAIVQESHEPGARVADVALRHNVSRSHLSLWRKQAAEGVLTLTPRKGDMVPAAEYRALQEEVRELQRMLGRKTMEAEYLRREIFMLQAQAHTDPVS
jgi:transposase